MSKEISVAVPTVANQFSAQIDLAGIDPRSVIGRLSASLGPSDMFAIYGSQDPASTGSSVNLTYIANVYGNEGESAPSPQFSGWRFLFLKRVPSPPASPNPGTFFASGNTAAVLPVAPASVALPSHNGFAGLSLLPFAAPVRLGLSANMTANDVFDVYATDDASTTNKQGTVLVGPLQGGVAA